MTDPVVLLGLPLDFKGKFFVYPPKVKDVIGNTNYPKWIKSLTLSQEEIGDALAAAIAASKIQNKRLPTPFEFLLNNSYHNEQYRLVVEEAIQFFTRYEAHVLPAIKMIVLGDLNEEILNIKSIDDLITIKEEDFFDFQNCVRAAAGLSLAEPPAVNEDPRITRMKAKIRYRERIKEKKGIGLNFEAIITSICCMGMGLNPLNIGELSYAAISALLRRYQEKEKYETDVRTLQSAFSSKNKIKPKYWIRNLE